ncbi:MAG: GNAT family N-acetyltransferase [Methanophagales archaeon]|nr:GNAT family N-acetyltransferase [Methanophagales archaeon]
MVERKEEFKEFIDSLDEERKSGGDLTMEMIEVSDPLIIKRENNKIVGVCCVRRYELINDPYLIIKKEFQGRGYGTMLTKKLIEQSKGKINAIVLRVIIDNAPAIHVYQACGFKRLWKRRRNENTMELRMFIPLNRKGWFTPLRFAAMDIVLYLKRIKSLEPLISYLIRHIKKYLRIN